MFGVGLSINLKDLRNILHSPKPFWLGLFAQMILLPVIAFAVIYFTDMPPALKVGFIILAACPGGTTSGFVNVLYRGNVALSVTLTTINSILTLLTIPLLVNFALTVYLGRHSPFKLPFMETFLEILFVTLLPAAAGVFIKVQIRSSGRQDPEAGKNSNDYFICRSVFTHRLCRRIKRRFRYQAG